MSQAWLLIALFVLMLALLPIGLKWVQRRVGMGTTNSSSVTRIVSAVGLGPHQRVVTVEVGPIGQRTWLILGVTTQSITCLHTIAVGATSLATADSTEVQSAVVSP